MSDRLNRIEKLIAENARRIEALSADDARNKRQREFVRQLVSNLNVEYETDYDRIMKRLSDRKIQLDLLQQSINRLEDSLKNK